MSNKFEVSKCVHVYIHNDGDARGGHPHLQSPSRWDSQFKIILFFKVRSLYWKQNLRTQQK